MFRRYFNPGINYSIGINWSLLLLRLTSGGLMLTHGIPKWNKLFGEEPITFADPIGLGEVWSLILVTFAEVVCSILVMLGLVTRMALFFLIITMAVAAFVQLVGDPLNKIELPLFYLMVFISLLISGAGKYSIDNWIYKKF
jgi:putative oxidoreductase